MEFNPHSDIPWMVQECAAMFSTNSKWRVWQDVGFYWMCSLADRPRMTVAQKRVAFEENLIRRAKQGE